MVHTDVLADTGLHQDNISECMISLLQNYLAIEGTGRKDDCRLLRNTNQVQLPHQPLWFAQESAFKKKNKNIYNQMGIK